MKIAIISDIHEDIVSLHKAARLIEKERCDEVICLGDIVGFSVPFYHYYGTRDASACVKWVKEHCRYTVAGNHDLYAIRKLPRSEVRGFAFPEGWYGLPYPVRKEVADGKLWLYEDNELSALLDDEAAEYLAGLPESVTIEPDGRRCMLTHFISPDITGSATTFLIDLMDLNQHLAYLKEHRCTVGFSGHMHAAGLIRPGLHGFVNQGFGRSAPLAPFDWVGAPSISDSKHASGFIIWDTLQHTIEARSLKRKFNMRIKT